MKTIAIIGGGPAGAMAARCLLEKSSARNNDDLRVVIFEEKLGWEKPCGGGLSHQALRRYPFLLEAEGLGKPIWEIGIWAPDNAVLRLRLREPLVICSRRKLNHFLLRRSQDAGAEVLNDRIVGMTRSSDGWQIKGRADVYQADYVIVAAGARSRLRESLVGPLSAQDFMLTFGYYVPAQGDEIQIEFFRDFEGYAWSFPRLDHLSVGICGKAGQTNMRDMQRKLDGFMKRCECAPDSAPVFSHLLPSLQLTRWSDFRLNGPGWALAGDVAGLADPVTGEGIYFALRSGELLADSVLAGSPESYARNVWDEFGEKLRAGAKMCETFYCGDFLGVPVTTRMLQFSARSKTFQKLFQDLLEGAQSYSSLAARLYRTLPKSLLELAMQGLADRFRFRSA